MFTASAPPPAATRAATFAPSPVVSAPESTRSILGLPSGLEQVRVQEIPEIQIPERIQEQLERIQEHIGREQIEEQLIAEETTQNPMVIPVTIFTSTSSDRRLDEFTHMLDSCIALLTPMTAQIESIEKETERGAMLTMRMMEPPMVESGRASAKRRRRTRYTPLPEIMENAVCLAPSAWPPTRRA